MLDWIIRQTWKDVLMVHHVLDPRELQQHSPFPLDLFEGRALISIVPFRMTDIRFPFTPSVPLISSLWELNLRTYVRIGNEIGVYFVTLDSDSLLGVLIARKFFSLPYRQVPLIAKSSKNYYKMNSNHLDHSFQIETDLVTAVASAEDLKMNLWATERYQLFTIKNNQILRGRVKHKPWDLKPVKLVSYEENLTKMVGQIKPLKSSMGFYQDNISVQFSPFELVNL